MIEGVLLQHYRTTWGSWKAQLIFNVLAEERALPGSCLGMYEYLVGTILYSRLRKGTKSMDESHLSDQHGHRSAYLNQMLAWLSF